MRDLLYITSKDGKLMTSPFRGIGKIRVACLIYTDLYTVYQDNIMIHNVILDQAIEDLMAPVAAT